MFERCCWWSSNSRRWAERCEAGDLWLSLLIRPHVACNMNAGASGFKNAPMTRITLVACGVISLTLATQGNSRLCTFSYQRIIQRLELWRLVMAPLVFPSLPELVFGIYLLYFFRVFERQSGSTKYLFFLLFTTVVTTLLELVCLFVLKDLSSLSTIRLNSGPFGLIFSSFVSFFFDIPASTHFKVLGVQVSEKSFVYSVGLQLLLWSWMRSMIPGLCGLIAGLIYRWDVAGVQELGFSPGAFVRFARRVAPFISGISPEMALRLNDVNREAESSSSGCPHEVSVPYHQPRHGWNAEGCLCRCIYCSSYRRSLQASGSRLQSKGRSFLHVPAAGMT